jgi:hypothetical protein
MRPEAARLSWLPGRTGRPTGRFLLLTLKHSPPFKFDGHLYNNLPKLLAERSVGQCPQLEVATD